MTEEDRDVDNQLAWEFMVDFFDGNQQIAEDWFTTSNPSIGYTTPCTLLNSEETHEAAMEMIYKIYNSKEKTAYD